MVVLSPKKRGQIRRYKNSSKYGPCPSFAISKVSGGFLKHDRVFYGTGGIVGVGQYIAHISSFCGPFDPSFRVLRGVGVEQLW